MEATIVTSYIDNLFHDLEGRFPAFAGFLQWLNPQLDQLAEAVAARLGDAGVLAADAVLTIFIDEANASGHPLLAGALMMVKQMVDMSGVKSLPHLACP